MADALHIRYRPGAWSEVLGQDEVVASMGGLVESRSQHAFLLGGMSGCGKTSLARIAANVLGCGPGDIVEVDAATNTGIDDMRRITDKLNYVPLGGGSLCLIIDECHRLSGAAWASLLKSVEEPPDWAYWFFCTTDAAKVPTNITTRCAKYLLKPLTWNALLNDLLVPVAELEKFSVSEKVLGICARAAEGSPRQALVNLAACADVTDEGTAARILEQVREDGENGAVIRLARALMQGAAWKQLIPIINELKDQNAEGTRRELMAYMTKVATDPKQSDAGANRAFAVMDNLSTSFNYSDGFGALVLALGRVAMA